MTNNQTERAEKMEAAYEKISEGLKELIEAEYEGKYAEAIQEIDLDVAAGNVGLYYEEEYKGILLEKAEQQKQQQEKERIDKELSELVDIIYNAKNEQEAKTKLEKFGIIGYRM